MSISSMGYLISNKINISKRHEWGWINGSSTKAPKIIFYVNCRKDDKYQCGSFQVTYINTGVLMDVDPEIELGSKYVKTIIKNNSYDFLFIIYYCPDGKYDIVG